MALAVCLLLDDRAASSVRALWRRLEEAGVPTLLSHTHGRHVPHLSYASLLRYEVDAVAAALASLPAAAPTALHLDGLGTFRRSRCWLAPAIPRDLVARQEAVVAAVHGTGAELHRHYRPGSWLPHVTLAPRVRLADLPVVAARVYDVLPISARLDRAALVDTSTGEVRVLPHLI